MDMKSIMPGGIDHTNGGKKEQEEMKNTKCQNAPTCDF